MIHLISQLPISYSYPLAALGFSAEQYAFVASIGFTFVFSLASLVAGNFVDRYPRNSLLAYSCAAMGIITLLQGAAPNYLTILILRSMLAFTQSFFNPAVRDEGVTDA